MSQSDKICKALEIIRQCLINIRHGREEHNQALIEDLNAAIIDIETYS